jgi:hypothetical protein
MISPEQAELGGRNGGNIEPIPLGIPGTGSAELTGRSPSRASDDERLFRYEVGCPETSAGSTSSG